MDDGILYKKRGIGMFVAAGAKEAIRQKRRDAFYEQYVTALVKEGQSLGLSPAEMARMVARAAEGGTQDE